MEREKLEALLDENGKVRKGGQIQDPQIIAFLQTFRLPLRDRAIEEMIRQTLDIRGELTDRDLLLAVLSALLCPLHQNIGSCFATAPAILIHQEQPLQFLKDLKELLTRGTLTRVFGGNTYSVPICIVTNQDEHNLLKSWEYTLASFVDVKAEFSSWNLYSSLGLEAEEKGGIGQIVYTYLSEQLEEANEKVKQYQLEYETAFDQVKTAESLLRGASTEADIRRLKAEHQGRVYHLEACEEMRDKYHQRAQWIANFFSEFIETVIDQFPKHFQEVYDPQMRLPAHGTYDDAPAGFRLLYKHGRENVSSWTLIQNKEDYTRALIQFFNAIEHVLIEKIKKGSQKKEITRLITTVVHHIGTKEFVESALQRMTRARHAPIGQKNYPWAYISGGTVTTLLQTYFCLEAPLAQESRWVDSPQDLLIFLLETMKKLPPRITNLYKKDPNRRMLMASPTHVFSLLPGQPFFRKGWEDPGFTYTWVRDQIDSPILFADSNWEGVYFAFVTNGDTGKLELWRTDAEAKFGEPMGEWDAFLNGTSKQPWIIFTNPFQYQALN